MNVNVHIRELVLHGLPAASGDAVAAEVCRAIETHLARGAAWTGGVERNVVDAGSFSWPSGSSRELSAGIAAGVSQAVLP